MRRLPLRSPPRVRGKEWYLQGESPAPGITPACAGKRTAQRSQRCQKWDHPRVCGEKTLCRSTVVPVWGSPPRMRGKGHIHILIVNNLGITPAYAGKSALSTFSSRKNSGSPPRMRGKVSVNGRGFILYGITPAYAGKRVAGGFRPGTTQDHPRVCGEKGSSTFWSRNHSGSPPRMRGKGQVSVFLRVFVGITPACAGKSCSSSVSSSQRMSWTIRSRI